MADCWKRGCRQLKRTSTYDGAQCVTIIKTICEECGRTVSTATLTDEQRLLAKKENKNRKEK